MASFPNPLVFGSSWFPTHVEKIFFPCCSLQKSMTFDDMGMDQYILIPCLMGWTSIYQLFWCSPGVLLVLTHCHMLMVKPHLLLIFRTTARQAHWDDLHPEFARQLQLQLCVQRLLTCACGEYRGARKRGRWNRGKHMGSMTYFCLGWWMFFFLGWYWWYYLVFLGGMVITYDMCIYIYTYIYYIYKCYK